MVTGAAQGIGRAIAVRLLQSGAAVSLWDQDAALVQETAATLVAQGRTLAVPVDVSNYDSVTAHTV